MTPAETIAALRAVGAEATPHFAGVQEALLEAFGGSDDIVWDHWTAIVNADQRDRNLSSLALDVIEAAESLLDRSPFESDSEIGADYCLFCDGVGRHLDSCDWAVARAALDTYLSRAQEALDDR